MGDTKTPEPAKPIIIYDPSKININEERIKIDPKTGYEQHSKWEIDSKTGIPFEHVWGVDPKAAPPSNSAKAFNTDNGDSKIIPISEIPTIGFNEKFKNVGPGYFHKEKPAGVGERVPIGASTNNAKLGTITTTLKLQIPKKYIQWNEAEKAWGLKPGYIIGVSGLQKELPFELKGSFNIASLSTDARGNQFLDISFPLSAKKMNNESSIKLARNEYSITNAMTGNAEKRRLESIAKFNSKYAEAGTQLEVGAKFNLGGERTPTADRPTDIFYVEVGLIQINPTLKQSTENNRLPFKKSSNDKPQGGVTIAQLYSGTNLTLITPQLTEKLSETFLRVNASIQNNNLSTHVSIKKA
jgi:hypothetical protein